MRQAAYSRPPGRQPVASPPPKRRRRKRNYSLYYLMVFILVAAAGIVLSLTVFFKISQVGVDGTTQYDMESIITYSKIKVGDNIFRTDYEKAKSEILKNLIYIDDVQISKSLSCQVTIHVEPSVPTASVQYEGGYLLVSANGKILEQLGEPLEGLRIIKGFNPSQTEIGEKLVSDDAEKDKLTYTLCEILDRQDMPEIAQMDISDPYNAVLRYEDRIDIELGSASDLEYKIHFAYEMIHTKISKKTAGTLFMREDNGASFMEEGDLEHYRETYQTAVAETSELAEEPSSDPGETTSQSAQ